MLAWKITANDRYQVDLAVERGRGYKVRCSAAQRFLYPRKRGLYRVKSHRTNNQNGHSSILPLKNMPHTGVESLKCSITTSKKASILPNLSLALSLPGRVCTDW